MSEFLDNTGFISSSPKPEPEPEPIPEEKKAEAIEVEEEEILVELPYTIEDFEELFQRVKLLEEKLDYLYYLTGNVYITIKYQD